MKGSGLVSSPIEISLVGQMFEAPDRLIDKSKDDGFARGLRARLMVLRGFSR